MSEAKTVVFEFGPESKKMLLDLTAALVASKASGGGGAKPTMFGGPTFPFGRSKGRPIAGASLADLQWVGERVAQSVADPSRARYREQDEKLLAAINAELERQGARPFAVPAGPADDDVAF